MNNNKENEGVTIVTTQGAVGETKVFIINKITLDACSILEKNGYGDFKIMKTEHRQGKILK